MISRENAVAKIVAARIQLVLSGEIIENFGDAAKVNRLAEVYGGTYTEAWDSVRVAYKQQIKKLAEKVDKEVKP